MTDRRTPPLTTRQISGMVEAKLVADLSAISKRLAEAWEQRTKGRAASQDDVDALMALARRLLTALAITDGPLIVAAQQLAVDGAVKLSRPEGVREWRVPDPRVTAPISGTVRGGAGVGPWLLAAVLSAIPLLTVAGKVAMGRGGDVGTLLATALGPVAGRVLVGARTAVHDSARTARIVTYRANPRTVTGWRWVCSLSDRSCLACVALHGTIFPLDETFQAAHVGCECESAPEVTGQSPYDATGEDWLAAKISRGELENVPPTVRDDVLNGRVELRDFLTRVEDERYGNQYRQSTVTEARRRAAVEGRL